MAKALKVKQALLNVIPIWGLADLKPRDTTCDELTAIWFHYEDTKTIICIQYSGTLYSYKGSIAITNRADFEVITELMEKLEPLNEKETAEIILQTKQIVFDLIQSHCKQNSIDFPDCFSSSVEQIVSDIRNRKIKQICLDPLEDKHKV